MLIAPNVHQLTVGEAAFVGVQPPNVYLVTGSDGAAFIDTSFGRDEDFEAQVGLWESVGRPKMSAIVLTHRHHDHIGGASRLQAVSGGQIVSSKAEKGPIEAEPRGPKVSMAVSDGDTLDLGGATLQFVEAPGHTLGSLCVLHKEEGILFTGDTVLGKGSTSISPDHGDMTLYIRTLERLIGLDSSIIAPGHGSVVDQPRSKLEVLIRHRVDRESQIVGLLRDGSRSVDDLYGTMYPELDNRLQRSAKGQIRSHLIKLERDEKVVPSRNGDGGYELA
jgi:ribonuclease/clavin/mitogillin